MTKPQSQSLTLGLFICALASLFYLYDFVLRVIPSVMSEHIMAQYHVTGAGYGAISSFFFLGYMLLQVPSGLLCDTFGPKRLLTINCFIASIAAYLFLASNSFAIASISRFLMGAGSAFAYIGALVLVLRWLPKRYYAMSAGLIQLVGALGAIIGQAPLAYLLSKSTPFDLMTNVAICGFILTLLFLFFIIDYPKGMEKTIAKHSDISTSERLKNVLTHPQNWYVALYGFCIWAPISIFGSLWDVPFLQARNHISATSAATLGAGIWIGIAIGGPVLGWLSAYLKLRRTPLLIAACIGFVSSLLILYDTQLSPTMLELCLVLYGIAGSAQAVTFGVIDDNNAPRYSGTAAGFNNMCIVLGGAILQPLVGLLLRYILSSRETITGVPHYQLADYQYALVILPACFLLATFVAIFLIKETRCKPTHVVLTEPSLLPS